MLKRKGWVVCCRALTAVYATANFFTVISPFHSRALLNIRTMERHPISPSHATAGWKYERRLENWSWHSMRCRRLYLMCGPVRF